MAIIASGVTEIQLPLVRRLQAAHDNPYEHAYDKAAAIQKELRSISSQYNLNDSLVAQITEWNTPKPPNEDD